MKVLIRLFTMFVFVFFIFSSIRADKIVKAENTAVKQQLTQDTTKTNKKVNLGIGPVKDVTLGPINNDLVTEGRNIFNNKCIACHQLESRSVGPALIPVVKNSSPVYVMNYLLNTKEMQEKEPEIKEQIKAYRLAMPVQNLDEKQARAILEFLRYNVKEK
jgi:mono/diheme cytochrome c family protein